MRVVVVGQGATLSKGSCRLVFVGEDGDLYQTGPKPQLQPRAQRLTWGWESAESDGRLTYVWPSYSPDGSLVACFGVRPGAGDRQEAGLYAVTEDGVSMHEIWRTSRAVPICESWSPDSSRIAILLQAEDGLSLEVANVRQPGETFIVERGSPLFWSWSPVENLIAVHTGGSHSVYDDARLAIFDTREGCEQIASLSPGEFRTPAWSPDGRRVAYVDAGEEGREFLAIYRLDDRVSEIVQPVEGHSAMLWSPDGRYLAISQALGETPHLFTGVSLVDVRTGRVKVVSDDNVVSFFWSPCSERLLTVSFSDSGGMQWSSLDVLGMRETIESRFYPSRELVYFCWFFDQFAMSHPLVSPDGRSLTFAGHVTAPGGQKLDGESGIYIQSLVVPGPPERIGPGHFGCWDAHVR